MPFPGINVTFGDAVPAAGAPTDTGQWFVAGLSEKGVANTPVKITSLSSFQTKFGARQTDSVLFDAIETYFREGGTTVWVSRVVGPAPVSATVALTGAAAAASIQVTAKGPGTYGSALRVAVLAGTVSGVRIQVSTVADGVLETSPDLTTVADIVTWSASSSYVNITANGTAMPSVIAAQALVGGTDDRAAVTNTQWANALAGMSSNLGPGQVSMPGQSSSAQHIALLAHAKANNRVAILDTPNSATLGTLTSAATAARADANANFGGMFGPWVSIPGIVPGTTRTVPYSAVEAGLIARSDRYFNQGRAVAGREFPLQYAVSFTEYTDAEHETALVAGLNLPKNVNGTLETYGFRSLVDGAVNKTWIQLNYRRLAMAIVADLNNVAEAFVFSQMDGAGHNITAFKDAITGVLLELYVSGALYGATASDAYRVDVGESVNTPTTIENGELHARVGVKMSPHAEVVYVDVSKTPLTQTV